MVGIRMKWKKCNEVRCREEKFCPPLQLQFFRKWQVLRFLSSTKDFPSQWSDSANWVIWPNYWTIRSNDMTEHMVRNFDFVWLNNHLHSGSIFKSFNCTQNLFFCIFLYFFVFFCTYGTLFFQMVQKKAVQKIQKNTKKTCILPHGIIKRILFRHR